jgi:hypothetical protein
MKNIKFELSDVMVALLAYKKEEERAEEDGWHFVSYTRTDLTNTTCPDETWNKVMLGTWWQRVQWRWIYFKARRMQRKIESGIIHI